MKTSTAVIIATVIALLLTPIAASAYQNYLQGMKFVTSKGSKYCYYEGHVNKRIKIKKYYPTLQACGKPLKNL